MMNINSYFEIDWEATSGRLKRMLRGNVSVKILSEALYADPRTIRNWLNNTTELPLSKLIIFARFLDVDLLDILVTKGQQCPLTENDVKVALHAARQKRADMAGKSGSELSDCVSKEDFCSSVLFHEYRFQKSAFPHLDRFLIYLPLFNADVFQDVLQRLVGNIGSNPNYVVTQLDRLYQTISDCPAKRYADQFSYYHLTAPTVKEVQLQALEPLDSQKLQQYEAWIRSTQTAEGQEAYDRALQVFIKKLGTYDKIRRFLREIAENDCL